MQAAPFFIFGTKRGGTTLLRLMLNANPKIFIPNESHFLLPVFKKFNPNSYLKRSEQYELIDLVAKGGRFDTWNSSMSHLKVIIESCPDLISLSEIIKRIYWCEAEANIKQPGIVGDKTPEYTDCITDIRQLYPESKFIFIVRDARDVSASLKARGWEGWTHYQRGLYWNSVVSNLIYLKNDERNILIRYEDLVRDQEKLMRQLSIFLEVEYSPNMLSFNSNYKNHLTHTELKKNIHTSIAQTPGEHHVSRWKKCSHNDDFYYIEKICQSSLQDLGYELSYSELEFKHPGIIRKLHIYKYKISIILYNLYHKYISKHFSQDVKSSFVFHKLRAYLRTK